MATIALHSAASGLSALSTQLDIIANNLANSNTDGFKASRGNFQDLLYEERRQPGTVNANGDERPTGLYVGLGVQMSGTQLDFRQGSSRPTGRPYDILIEDDRSFFQVTVESDLASGGIAYTRAGNFVTNSEGQLVLATDQGRILDPQIVIPENAQTVTIGKDGIVSILEEGSETPSEVGQIETATFINPTGLRQVGENLYVPSAASGPANSGNPGEEGRGGLLQGSLESSNVDPVTELVDLIRTQRAFELNSQSIQAADEALQTIGQLRRF
ncbi:MAG: flagellar basal-body rod protein FlgG [Planctomycetota bacterium]